MAAHVVYSLASVTHARTASLSMSRDEDEWGRSTSIINYDLIVFGSGPEEPIDILAHSCLASWWAVTAMSRCNISATSG